MRRWVSGRIAWRSLARGVVFALGLLAVLAPHGHRFGHPSIYSDDVARIFVVRTRSLGESLTTPFNEHLAPFFDAVTWLAWLASGRRLSSVAGAFTVAAFVPFVLSLLAIGVLVRRELGTWAASLVVMVAFAAAPVHAVETVWWYSGSNHMWALFWGVVALLGAGQGGWPGALVVAVGSMLAPACSLMGLLVAPSCVVYAGTRRLAGWRTIAAAAVVGLGAYLALGACFGLVRALLMGRTRESDLPLGLIVAAEAPSLTLLPNLVGLDGLELVVPPAWAILCTAVMLTASLVWAWRSPSRAVVLVGVFFIAGVYLLIFPFRAADGQTIMLHTARYHLFPQLGLALLLGAILRKATSGRWGELVAGVACVVLLAVHLPRQFAENSLYDFPNQARTLRALDRVRAVCRAEGITDLQAVAALEPIRPHWMPLDLPGANVARLIGPIPTTHPVSVSQVRSRLLAALSLEDRQGLFGGMDAGPYFEPASLQADAESRLLIARPVVSQGVEPSGPNNAYKTVGWPAYLEYQWDAPPEVVAQAHSLIVPVDAPEGGVEVWWNDDQTSWTTGRSMVWTVGEDRPRGLLWSVPLDRLPHWNAPRVRRLRVMFRYPGTVFVQPPRLLLPGLATDREEASR